MIKSIFLIVILISNCKEIKKPFFKPNESSSGKDDFFISYAEKNTFEYPIDHIPEFEISIEERGEKKCLYSNSAFFLNQEWGPKLGLCFEGTKENDRLLKEIFSASVLKVSGDLKFKNYSLPMEVRSQTELVNDLSDLKQPEFFFGDENLELALRKKLNQEFRSSISLSGISGRKIESSFALPYFSIVKSELIYKLIFPRKKGLYIVLDISSSEEMIQETKNFFGSIEQKHSEILLSCTEPDLELSEVGLGKNEFIEWVEKSSTHTCGTEIKFSMKEKEYTFPNPSEFSFAGSTKLLSEKSHIGENFPEFERFWKDLKTETKIEIVYLDKKDSIQIPKGFLSSYQDIEMSFKKRDNLCIWSNLYEMEKTCADPGIDISLNEEFFKSQCDPNHFQVSEMNAYGIRDKEKINRDGKFLELLYTGNTTCKLAGLNLTIGSRRIPIFDTRNLQPNDLILIGKKEFFMQTPNLISYDIDFWNIRDRISLRNFTTQAILFKGLKSTEEIIFEDKFANVYSIFHQNEKILHHKKSISKELNPFYRTLNFMSPGEKNPNFENNASAYFSEIHWAGSYKNKVSIPEDDFIEIVTSGNGTLQFEFENRNYIFPVNSESPYIVLAPKPLACFPKSKIITLKDFTLKEEATIFKLVDSGNRIIEQKYNPAQNQGENNASSKKRFSYVFTSYDNLWRNSSNENSENIHQDCTDQTYASPDAPNQFAPFLQADINHGFRIITSSQNQNTNLQIRFYSYVPYLDQLENFVPSQKSNIVTIPNIDQSISLLYLEVLKGHSLNLINRNGIFLEAVLPSPSNAQNEWILICNRSSIETDLSKYEIEDEGNLDEIVSYFTRTKKNLPTGLNESEFKGDTSFLAPNQCAYIVDPDATNLFLKPIGMIPTLVQTVKATSSIGNGISSGEKLDFFYREATSRFHIHSFGNKYSHAPFRLTANTDEILFLKKNHTGETAQDYEVLKW